MDSSVASADNSRTIACAAQDKDMPDYGACRGRRAAAFGRCVLELLGRLRIERDAVLLM